MAISASVVVDHAYLASGQPTNVKLTIKNTGASAVTVADVCTFISGGQNYGGPIGKPHMGPGAALSVPASGTLTMTWSQSFFCGIQDLTKQFKYTIGATVYTTDGSSLTVTAASPQCNINVVPVRDASSVGAPAPLPGAFPNPPVAGQLRYDTNHNSGQTAHLTGGL